MAQVIIFTGSSLGHSIRAIGAYQVASRLRNHGYTVQVIEHFPFIFNKDDDTLSKIIKKYVDHTTIWIGFSSTFFENNLEIINRSVFLNPVNFSLEKLNYIKSLVYSINQKCKFVLGGSKSSFLKIPNFIDYYVEGYSDDSVINLTKYLENKNPFFQFVTNTDKSRSIINDRKAALFDFSNYNFSWHPSDHIFKGEVLPIEISRGCIFKCAFCNYPLNGKKKLDFIKSPDVLLQEFKKNYDNYGTTKYVFCDDTHNDSVEKLEILFDKVYSKLPFKISFSAYIRLDLLKAHPHTIDLLKESGISTCFFGIESMNYESNKTIGKGLKPEYIVETLNLLKNKWKNVFKEAGFIVGLPYDSKETICNWLDLITSKEFPLDKVSLSPLRIIKNTKSFWPNLIESNPEDYGYVFTSEKHWINNKGLSMHDAIEIVKLYNNSEKVKTKSGWIYELISTKENFLEKQNKIINDYLTNLLIK